MHIIVKSISVHKSPIKTDYCTIYASLTLECGPLLISGVAFAQMDSGDFRVMFPQFKRDQRIILQGQDQREELLEKVKKTYSAITGHEPDETPVATATETAGNQA